MQRFPVLSRGKYCRVCKVLRSCRLSSDQRNSSRRSIAIFSGVTRDQLTHRSFIEGKHRFQVRVSHTCRAESRTFLYQMSYTNCLYMCTYVFRVVPGISALPITLNPASSLLAGPLRACGVYSASSFTSLMTSSFLAVTFSSFFSSFATHNCCKRALRTVRRGTTALTEKLLRDVSAAGATLGILPANDIIARADAICAKPRPSQKLLLCPCLVIYPPAGTKIWLHIRPVSDRGSTRGQQNLDGGASLRDLAVEIIHGGEHPRLRSSSKKYCKNQESS